MLNHADRPALQLFCFRELCYPTVCRSCQVKSGSHTMCCMWKLLIRKQTPIWETCRWHWQLVFFHIWRRHWWSVSFTTVSIYSLTKNYNAWISKLAIVEFPRFYCINKTTLMAAGTILPTGPDCKRLFANKESNSNCEIWAWWPKNVSRQQ